MIGRELEISGKGRSSCKGPEVSRDMSRKGEGQ